MLFTEANCNSSNLCKSFQWMLEAQNRRIDDLVEKIHQQQEKLEKQNVRIITLYNQVGYHLLTAIWALQLNGYLVDV